MFSKLKALNPICRMVNAHKAICEEVVNEAKTIVQGRHSSTFPPLKEGHIVNPR